MTKISIKELNGRECFSLSKDNVELFFEYDTTSFRMPMFLQLVFDGLNIPFYYDITEMVERLTAKTIYTGGKLSGIILCTNLPASEREFKAKTIEILNAIDSAIENAVIRNCFDQCFVKSTDSVIESIAKSITRHKNKIKNSK